jgi:hypothetical protein
MPNKVVLTTSHPYSKANAATAPDNSTAQIAETTGVANETEICRASCSNDTGIEVCTFTAKLDIFASDLGA